ncbi:MAG: cyclic nucleotide-binding domain-containing protein [Thermodesulfobacteriota bacterium]
MKKEGPPNLDFVCKPGDTSCELHRDFSILSGLPVFSGVPKEIVKMWAYFSKRAVFSPGEILLAQGDKLERAHCIVSGTAKALLVEDGREQTLYTLEAQDLFGELALLARLVSPVTVRAETEVVSLTLDRKSFWKVYEKFPRSLHHAVEQIVKLGVGRQGREIARQLENQPDALPVFSLLRGLLFRV